MRSAFIIFGFFLLTAFLLMTCKQNQVDTKQNTVATPEAAPPKLTTILWLDSIKDFGKVTEGEKLEANFRFRNTGSEQLVINNVVVSCGCTVAEKPEKPVAPGQEGVIKASFDSKGRPGPNHKTLTVYSNTKESVHTLMFDVEVRGKE